MVQLIAKCCVKLSSDGGQPVTPRARFLAHPGHGVSGGVDTNITPCIVTFVEGVACCLAMLCTTWVAINLYGDLFMISSMPLPTLGQAVAVTSVIFVTNSVFAVDARSIDGTGNNLLINSQGAAETQVIRCCYPSAYPDGFGDSIANLIQPNARDVSNAVNVQVGSILNNRGLSDWVVQWGQFLTHDMDLTGADATNNTLSTGAVGDFSIAINDPTDILGPNAITFNRSNYDPTTGTSDVIVTPTGNVLNAREQMNSVTSYIDASNVYGSDATRAAELRTFSGGKLATSASGLLPGLNSAGLDNDDPFGLGGSLYLAGDVRSNEQVGLTATHALFVREHNRLADAIQAASPGISDEDIYQTARKIVGAEMQAITYNEFLPALLGANAPTAGDYVYDNTVDASITNAFATAAFRFGHSMQSSDIALVDDTGAHTGALSLSDAFFDPTFLGNDVANVELVLKGLATQTAQENDAAMVDDIRNFLFGPPGAGGMDLAALDIQRGRDHGLMRYNALRASYGLPTIATFSNITSDTDLQTALASVYFGVNQTDAWVGMVSENHLPGASVGELTSVIIAEQFERLRDGDRYFYAGDSDLLSSLVTSIIDLSTITLSQIIELNTGLTSLQDNVFFAYDPLVGDFTGDGFVGVDDLNLILAAWNQSVTPGDLLSGDTDGDGFVGIDDLNWVLGNWNAETPAQSSVVPEPGTLVCLVGGMVLMHRRVA